jgi:CBS domain-containing protein
MQLKGIMAKNVLTITGEETIAGAARRMQEGNVGCLVITNAGSVQGIITDRDLAVRCISQGHNPQQCHVSNHMSSPVITTQPDMDILDAAHLMTEQKVKRLPVVEGDQLIGLVSFSDVAQAMDRPMHDLMVGMGAARRSA